MFKRLLGLIPLVVLLAACGSGGGDHAPTVGPDNPNPTPTGPVIGSIVVLTSSPQIASNGSATANITAYVRDAKNAFLEGVTVSFAASSGGIAVTEGVTDKNGVARAVVTPLDPTNRTITVTATATGPASGTITGTATGTVSVDVTGTQLSLSGPPSLAQNDVGTYTVSLRDSGGTGIAGKTITASSARSNTLSATTLTTNASGQATFTLTAANGGADTVRVTGLGLSATQTTTVSSDQFAFSTPANNAELPLNTAQTVTVRWTRSGVPQIGQTINFATTRGTPSSPTAVTNASGDATIMVQSANSGFGVVSASTADGITTERTVEFVANTPASIDVQATPFTVGTQEKSIVTAVVRDAVGNLVKNRIVQFSLQDVTGGQLSVASASTDSQGRAQSTYTASSGTSATNGVVITGTVQGTTISDAALVTVARREVFISLGTGNEIVEPNIAQYEMTYAVQVTDASGNGVANTAMTMEVVSLDYRKGKRIFVDPMWATPITPRCDDEDSGIQDPVTLVMVGARNGILDGSEDKNANNVLDAGEDLNLNGSLDYGEDTNRSGRIEAGNIATVTPKTVTTDANGFALVKVTYPQEHAYWVNVRLSATTAVQGSEYARSVEFLLPGSAADFTSETAPPPGIVSPFGVAAVCSDKN